MLAKVLSVIPLLAMFASANPVPSTEDAKEVVKRGIDAIHLINCGNLYSAILVRIYP
jgi:hypothetical protein